VPSSWDFHVPSSFAINSSENSPGRGEGKKKKEKKRERRDLDYYLRFFLVFLRPSKIWI